MFVQWNKVNNNTKFILQFNGIEKFINVPDGDGSVTYTASPLNPGTKFTFILFSVTENVRSSGARLTGATGELFYFVSLFWSRAFSADGNCTTKK